MILSMSGQAFLFLMTVAAGMAIGLIYDGFRVLRKTAPHAPVWVQLEDLLFWLAVTGLMFYFMLNENYGEIRIFSVLGAALGVTLYFATISRWVLLVLVAVVNFIKRVLTAVFKVLRLPFRLLVRLLNPPLTYVKKFFGKRLRSAARYAKMKAQAAAKDFSVIRRKI